MDIRKEELNVALSLNDQVLKKEYGGGLGNYSVTTTTNLGMVGLPCDIDYPTRYRDISQHAGQQDLERYKTHHVI